MLRLEHLLFTGIPGMDLLNGLVGVGCEHSTVRAAPMSHPVGGGQKLHPVGGLEALDQPRDPVETGQRV